MSNVSVDIAPLNTIKHALEDFQTDVDALSNQIRAGAEQVMSDIEASVKKQAQIVDQLVDRAKQLLALIHQLQEAISADQNKLKAVVETIKALEQKHDQLDTRIRQLEEQKQKLESQRGQSQDSSGIDNQIRSLEQQIRDCRSQLNQVHEKLTACKAQKAQLEQEIAELKAKKTKTESDYEETKAKMYREKNKLDRMIASAKQAETEINDLILSVQKFERASGTMTGHAKSGIAKCISAIDEYIATNIGASGGGAGGSAAGMGSTGGYSSGSRLAWDGREFLAGDSGIGGYASDKDVPDHVEACARDYQTHHTEYNQPMRRGETSARIERLRAVIHDHTLEADRRYVRMATLDDLGELSSRPVDSLVGEDYNFVGIMSATGSSSMAKMVSGSPVIFEISAPAGTHALDLTRAITYSEVMFDSPRCHIERVEHRGFNTTVIGITILPDR